MKFHSAVIVRQNVSISVFHIVSLSSSSFDGIKSVFARQLLKFFLESRETGGRHLLEDGDSLSDVGGDETGSIERFLNKIR